MYATLLSLNAWRMRHAPIPCSPPLSHGEPGCSMVGNRQKVVSPGDNQVDNTKLQFLTNSGHKQRRDHNPKTTYLRVDPENIKMPMPASAYNVYVRIWDSGGDPPPPKIGKSGGGYRPLIP